MGHRPVCVGHRGSWNPKRSQTGQPQSSYSDFYVQLVLWLWQVAGYEHSPLAQHPIITILLLLLLAAFMRLAEAAGTAMFVNMVSRFCDIVRDAIVNSCLGKPRASG